MTTEPTPTHTATRSRPVVGLPAAQWRPLAARSPGRLAVAKGPPDTGVPCPATPTDAVYGIVGAGVSRRSWMASVTSAAVGDRPSRSAMVQATRSTPV